MSLCAGLTTAGISYVFNRHIVIVNNIEEKEEKQDKEEKKY